MHDDGRFYVCRYIMYIRCKMIILHNFLSIHCCILVCNHICLWLDTHLETWMWSQITGMDYYIEVHYMFIWWFLQKCCPKYHFCLSISIILWSIMQEYSYLSCYRIGCCYTTPTLMPSTCMRYMYKHFKVVYLEYCYKILNVMWSHSSEINRKIGNHACCTWSFVLVCK